MYTLTPAEEIHARIAKLQAGLRAARLDAAFLVQNADLFYFTGSIQQGILIVPAEGEPVYFVRRVFERAVEESPLSNVRTDHEPERGDRLLRRKKHHLSASSDSSSTSFPSRRSSVSSRSSPAQSPRTSP